MNDTRMDAFDYKDVLIGTVKHKKQFYTAINNKFYHIPAFMVEDHPFPIKYIALYQSANLWGAESGISYYGEVESVQKIKRSSITELPSNSDEDYYVYNIKNWKKLIRPIKISENSIYVCEFTNLFLLTHSSFTYQLFLQSEEDFTLSCLLNDCFNDLRLNDHNSSFGFEFNGYTVEFKAGNIKVYKDDVQIVTLSISNFTGRFGQIFNALKNTMID